MKNLWLWSILSLGCSLICSSVYCAEERKLTADDLDEIDEIFWTQEPEAIPESAIFKLSRNLDQATRYLDNYKSWTNKTLKKAQKKTIQLMAVLAEDIEGNRYTTRESLPKIIETIDLLTYYLDRAQQETLTAKEQKFFADALVKAQKAAHRHTNPEHAMAGDRLWHEIWEMTATIFLETLALEVGRYEKRLLEAYEILRRNYTTQAFEQFRPKN
jgi:hypothetical protein